MNAAKRLELVICYHELPSDNAPCFDVPVSHDRADEIKRRHEGGVAHPRIVQDEPMKVPRV